MRYILSFISLIMLILTPGCIYDDLPIDGSDGNGLQPGDPLTLTFTVGVPAMGTDGETKGGGTRAIFYGNPLYYEDWIDTQDGFRVLFFITKREKTGDAYVTPTYDDNNNFAAVDPTNPLKDYFLFESTSRWVTQLPYDDNNNLRYRVTVPVYQIGNEENEYREFWKEIRDLLRTYDFKVAILANHPDCFTWTIKNSVLSAGNIDDLSKGGSNLKTINDIHHSVGDSNYATGGAGRTDGYSMLVDNKNKVDGVGAMGPYIDWVIMRSELYGDALGGTFEDKESARKWIRDYWRPDIKYNEDNDPDIDYQILYHNYRHVWSYWNFGGDISDNGLPYSEKSKINSHINEWEVRNGALLRDWIENAVETNNGILTDLCTKSQSEEKKYDGSLPLTYNASAGKGVITLGSNSKRFYGVTLPKLSSAPTSSTAKDCFHFKANAKGSLILRYVSNGGSLVVRGGTATIKAETSSSKTINGLKLTEAEYKLENILDKPLDCYIYSSDGGPTVYDIEFVQDQYLYLTDREGILPSSDHPIPMYGVQKYTRLEGFWEEGASFDLTAGGYDENGEGYPSKNISLLRAVAKIEVLIPKSLGVPRHVYMRSLNRRVRCEPMDVSTPTDLLWKDHNNGCEWELIQKHGTFFDGGVNTTTYKKRLVWYYGNWLEWGWNFNGQTQYIPSQSEGPFPRIMNPYINRSDYAAFIDVSEYYNDQYYHYLFYMGENTLDASSQYNGDGGSPMVPHIEIRFDERYASTCKVGVNTDLNICDNDCYRIYFTEGGIASGARDANGVTTIAKDQYDSKYDNNATYIKEHWPIMRNHVYKFTVQDVGGENMNGLVVNVQNRSADFNFK